MTISSVQVTAPSRLHFGLLSFGNPSGRQFGGLGVMVDRPGLRLSVRPAERLVAQGPLADRALEFARRVAAALGRADEIACRIDIHSAPPQHAGLGTGTQLGLSIAAAIGTLLELGPLSAERLAYMSGRGLRSAIGTHGFLQGGLLEEGKLPDEPVSPLVARTAMPDEWRFLLVTPRGDQGVSGDSEEQAFRQLPPVRQETTQRLLRRATDDLLPAVARGDFAAFSEALYDYGREAGLCFAPCQHGVYASPRIAATVDLLRRLGVRGAGQSSWGPTVYAALPSQAEAEQVVAQLECENDSQDLSCLITSCSNRGASIVIS